jgi:hypothetical protein
MNPITSLVERVRGGDRRQTRLVVTGSTARPEYRWVHEELAALTAEAFDRGLSPTEVSAGIVSFHNNLSDLYNDEPGECVPLVIPEGMTREELDELRGGVE